MSERSREMHCPRQRAAFFEFEALPGCGGGSWQVWNQIFESSGGWSLSKLPCKDSKKLRISGSSPSHLTSTCSTSASSLPGSIYWEHLGLWYFKHLAFPLRSRCLPGIRFPLQASAGQIFSILTKKPPDFTLDVISRYWVRPVCRLVHSPRLPQQPTILWGPTIQLAPHLPLLATMMTVTTPTINVDHIGDRYEWLWTVLKSSNHYNCCWRL